MCLAIPGEIISLVKTGSELPCAKVRFGSVTKEVCLVYTPEAKIGDYVIVHVGFAIQILNEEAAHETLKLLNDYEIPE
ncbi:HypC/HybG/HupF family hydrogenase formation chaperone [Pseudomaricurvus alkylphenolicus]|jgi:hydrogenase expression/formation protein HypC|uniref:HypC/HybG/HupF family hydrogenase formation chaperone n=1 Tax=Pseudomaricurvus alkylphenolicus TaxID=1306991 RepID=UPI001423CEBD|nr:HypC/HybG/HupF family hydrogenase formation chaperone [Pseudomaricurvus alkylphenolicus]NIB45015.1 HypC/HybG/HupF family hydrogenase formation chaperone [Pseudomaricurvus alkylphenolicus]